MANAEPERLIKEEPVETMVGNTMLSPLDIGVVSVYFLLVMGAGFFSMFRPNRGTVAGYFLAGRFMWWLPVGASIFASNIGSEHFIGLAGSGAASGIAVGAFEFNALVLLQLLGWVFLPVFIASGVTTLPEYMRKRYGGRRIRMCLAVLSVILYIFTKISVNLYSGAIFIQQALGWTNLYASIVVLLFMTGLCTVFGGLAAVIYTDTLQFFIMIAGSIYVMIVGLQKVGGYSELQKKYIEAIPSKLMENSTCGLPRTDSWVMLRDADPSVSDMPWPAFLFGQTPVSIWYWCADQMMVQRAMASKSLSHAQGATIFAGCAKLLPLFIIIIPGMISRVLFPDEVGCIDPDECYRFCGSRTSCYNLAYPKLVLEYMPSGMRGVMLSVMLAALMSDLTSIFNSASTLFTMDIWSWYRPKARAREQLFVGRLSIIILVVISILWVPIIERTQGGQLYIYIQAIAAYLAPPIAAIYCMSILWGRINEPGAFWGLMSGFLIGVVRMALDFYYGEPACYEDDHRPVILSKVHYMYFALLLFWLTVLISVIISFITNPPDKWRLIRTTFQTRFSRLEREDDLELKDRMQIDLNPYVVENADIVYEEPGKPWYSRVWKFILGYDDTEKAKQQAEAMNEHIVQLTNLEQGQFSKRILNSLLVLIVLIAIILYVIFTINPFTLEEIRDMQRTRLEELGYPGLL
ncbi:sodium/glucose cotransporter 4-like [Oratosquilla oratoria]|uniref:sodium/glucose cotransporter 4-like n=1 Tax=Oratosquilla oratoria TaxID=337810 RepID=UPI003F75F8BF